MVTGVFLCLRSSVELQSGCLHTSVTASTCCQPALASLRDLPVAQLLIWLWSFFNVTPNKLWHLLLTLFLLFPLGFGPPNISVMEAHHHLTAASWVYPQCWKHPRELPCYVCTPRYQIRWAGSCRKRRPHTEFVWLLNETQFLHLTAHLFHHRSQVHSYVYSFVSAAWIAMMIPLLSSYHILDRKTWLWLRTALPGHLRDLLNEFVYLLMLQLLWTY